MQQRMTVAVRPTQTVSCLIVGAGPTGLALAAQLTWFGVPFRIIDREIDRGRESRALAVQARTLELLDSLGVADAMVARGSTSTRVVIHFGARAVASAKLGPLGAAHTRYPFILFISQAETERLLAEHLSAANVAIERGAELVGFEILDQVVDCVLKDLRGQEERVRAAYLIGCDGAHSFGRRAAGFSFPGGSYPEDFVLGDVEADGPLEPGAINSFVGGGGAAIFFPLGSPTTWRVIGMRALDPASRHNLSASNEPPIGSLTIEELQSVVGAPTEGTVVVRDAAWLSHFRLHHRQIAKYRLGRVFLAGDAAHIHSPVGAQGMNTGIQDAWNLGWKLALVIRGEGREQLLDTYEAERWPIGRSLLRYTDRIFSTFTRAMSAGRIATWARELVVPRLLPSFLESPRMRSAAFRFVSELGIRYRHSPATVEGRPRLRSGPRAGDRLPDAQLRLDGQAVSLQRAVVGPHFSLLLCGEQRLWDAPVLRRLAEGYRGLLKVHHVVGQRHPRMLVDDADALGVQAAQDGAQLLIRPDGYIAFRGGGHDLAAVSRYLRHWCVERTP
jgi:2-polyprenyl-6-methoxyphenol hydroxylase-like FAD-dependent oxidoreductase